MATTRKVLGQVSCTVAGWVALYTVPALNSTVISTLTICNIGAANQFSVRIRVGGAVAVDKHLLFNVNPISPNQTIAFTAGLTLGPGDVFEVGTVVASAVVFNIFGEETA